MTFFVVDAIGEGHRVARCIDRHLRGEQGLPEPLRPAPVEIPIEQARQRIESGAVSPAARIAIDSIPLEARRLNFREVDLPLSEQQAQDEAERCLRCGVCAECLECLVACDRGAIDHEMHETRVDLKVGTIVLATGFKDFDAGRAPELGYGVLPNVITAMEFERMLNPGGPTGGKVRLANGAPPQSVALVHCVGSRDARFHDYCSRACCMYGLKLATLMHEYVGAQVHEIYRDLRCFGKGYEEFSNRTAALGVQFHHGHVREVARQADGRLTVRWDEAFHGQADRVTVDMVVLATGFEPQTDAAAVASLFGISRSRDGFFLERHPKLAPVETASEGIYLAGACQAPKDIPDSVAQAGGAAAAALSLIDQGTIALEPSIAEVQAARCAGCGQCAEACPYGAIEVLEGVAQVNGFLCKGCGTCSAACPSKAVTLIHFHDAQILSELAGALGLPALPLRPPVGAEVR